MLEGVLIGESLRVGARLAGVPLRVARVSRIEVPDPGAGQPALWTLLDFTADEADAEPLAEQLAAALAPVGGWYVNCNTAAEAFVVFPGKVFRYPRGQGSGRALAKAHGRSLGIPEGQLDWQD